MADQHYEHYKHMQHHQHWRQRDYSGRVSRCPRLLALAALLLGFAAWCVAPAVASAQSDEAVIELSFVTAGESSVGDVSIVDLSTGTEYRNAAVSQGEPIRVAGVVGETSRLQTGRTEMQPIAVSCEGAENANAIATSRGVALAITPAEDVVACTVTLSEELAEELAKTGRTSTLGVVGAILLGEGLLVMAAARRSTRY